MNSTIRLSSDSYFLRIYCYFILLSVICMESVSKEVIELTILRFLDVNATTMD